MKVYEFAEKLSMTAVELLELLEKVSISGKGYASMLTEEEQDAVRLFLGRKEVSVQDASSQPEEREEVMPRSDWEEQSKKEKERKKEKKTQCRKRQDRKREGQSKKEKKTKRTMRPGVRRMPVLFLWGLLIASLLFGIYKSFTAVDRHTIHERQVVSKELKDTHRIENFVRAFGAVYYSWGSEEAELSKRQEALNGYLTQELLGLNKDDIKVGKNRSIFKEMTIWDVSEEDGEYRVTYQVTQEILGKKTTSVLKKKGKKTQKVSETTEEKREVRAVFSVVVHEDRKGNLVIVKNPTPASLPEKSGYEPKTGQEDGGVDADTRSSVESFLKTFFTLYPRADAKELSFYVTKEALHPIQKDYRFGEILSSVIQRDGAYVDVSVNVRYENGETGQEMISQFDLVLKRVDQNWKILKTGNASGKEL